MPAYNSDFPVSSQGTYSFQGDMQSRSPFDRAGRDRRIDKLRFPPETYLCLKIETKAVAYQDAPNKPFNGIALAEPIENKKDYFRLYIYSNGQPIKNKQTFENKWYGYCLVDVTRIQVTVDEGYDGKWGYAPRSFKLVGKNLVNEKSQVAIDTCDPDKINDWLERYSYIPE